MSDEVYIKIIDYKRSIGITQWTVFSLFATASIGILLFSFQHSDKVHGTLIRIFGLSVYSLGYLLYQRYRKLNVAVSKYLCELEDNNGYRLQKTLNESIHGHGLSTNHILLIGFFVYTAICSLVFLLK